MAITFKAHFDGTVIIPDEPVDLVIGVTYDLIVNRVEPSIAISKEERLARLRNAGGRFTAHAPSAESLRRENMYED
ncbi:MAG: hypothetical protein ABJA67_08015 [Chthonomonadales bacterium]